MGEGRKAYRVLLENQKERDLLEDWGVDGRMGLEWILGKCAGVVWSGFTWLRIVTGGALWWMQWRTFRFWHHRASWLVIEEGKTMKRIFYFLQHHFPFLCKSVVEGSNSSNVMGGQKKEGISAFEPIRCLWKKMSFFSLEFRFFDT
jgi:hypothetical protein